MEERGKILIVDDKPENLFALEQALRPLAVDAVKAASGSEALRASLRHDFALAIVDVLMPGMDGYELVRLLRGQAETKALPVIFLTAILPDEEHFSRGYESGAVDFLHKPVNQEILLSKVRVFLELDRNKRELLRQKTALEGAVRKLEGAKEQLEREMAARQSMEDELRRAKEEADRANQAKSEFLANMSHEIRTPMNGILGMTELAYMTAANPKVREYLQLARQSGQALLDIINDILDLSRIEAGKIELIREPFRPREVVEEIIQTMRVGAQAKGVDLLSSIDPETPEVLLGDKGRLRQILTNLVGNAVKFTERGTVAVSVGVEEEIPPRSVRLLFVVTDQGIGIPAGKLDAIFEPFSQASNTSAHAKYGGAGLGLAISRQLAELMGGRIWVSSEEGKGSTFSFTAAFDAGREETPPAPEAKPQAERPGQGAQVLLVEDNAVNRVLAVELLKRRGHEVQTAENGQEALEQLARRPFDLVLMDVRMPVMDGLETTRRIRQGQAGNPRVPIVALTAHALKGDAERLLSAGMDDYLPKPIDLKELDRVLGRVLGSGRRVATTH